MATLTKLLSGAALAAVLVFPATASASEAGPPAGARTCSTNQVGIVVWVQDPKSGGQLEVVHYCIEITP